MPDLESLARQRLQKRSRDGMRVDGHVVRICRVNNVIEERAHLVLIAQFRADDLPAGIAKNLYRATNLLVRAPSYSLCRLFPHDHITESTLR